MTPTQLTTAARALTTVLVAGAFALALGIGVGTAQAESTQSNYVTPLPVPENIAALRTQPALGVTIVPMAPGEQPLSSALLKNYIARQAALRAFTAFDEANPSPISSNLVLGYISRTTENNRALDAIAGASNEESSPLNSDILANYVQDRFQPTAKRITQANKERDCLTQAIYHEARGESLQGQWAVANVIVNRALSKRFPSTLCGVIYQNADKGRYKCQFTFACDGKSDAPGERSAWRRSAGIASKVYGEFARGIKVPTLPRTALYYHTTAVNPSWSNVYTQVAQIGSHLFYAPN
ncbi:cell wall hydrolase [Devosia rhodophyticola]|uniref:Cell wall hydrolase n=1 Tax=Devosia rhodophyticola TaxID=3026423 RepID=A0ABY7Z091_9HYPH|nr:cell wall hydrolase [Devosia rhodophyticola]WDR06904.1 cell wall hydrolase [Devosia rhodophyticola]